MDTPRRFTLTAQQSSAKNAVDYQMRDFDSAAVGVSADELNNHFMLTQTSSKAVAPEVLQAAGKPLLYTGPARISADTLVVLAEQSRRIGAFIEKGTELYKTVLNEKGFSVEKHLANFTVEVRSVTTLIGLRTRRDMIHFLIRGASGNTQFAVEYEKYIEKFYFELRRKHPHCRLVSDFANAESAFKEYLSTVFEAARAGLPQNEEYAIAGWQDDCRYHSGSDPDCSAEYCLADISGMDLRTIALRGLKLVEIGDPRTTVPMFLHRHAGILAKLFDDAGHPIQHILALIGPRNSKKTSSAEIVFGTKGTNFTSTLRGMELYAESCHDRTVMIDDLMTVKNKEILKKFENFLRQYCDGRGRLKSVNGGTDLEQVDTRYGVVITGESSLTTLQQSSRTRIVEIQIAGDTFHNQNLRIFQENEKIAQLDKIPSWLDCYDSAFIRAYVEPHYVDIVRRIVCIEPPPLTFRYARQAETFRNFYSLLDIILDFYRQVNAVNEVQIEQYRAQWTLILQDLLRYNEGLCTRVEPYKLFLMAVSYGVDQGHLIIAASRQEYRTNASMYAGFREGGILALDSHRAYAYAESFYKGQEFCATENDVMRALRDNQVLEVYKEAGHKSKPFRKVTTVKGGETRMIFLIVAKVEQALAEE